MEIAIAKATICDTNNVTVFTSSSFKMWGNSIWKTLDVLLRLYLGTNQGEEVVWSPLFASSSLILLEFVVEFWSFHRNLLCSVYLRVVFLHRNRKTIMSLTIICHFTSVFLANVWNILIAPRSAKKNQRNPRKYRCFINNHNNYVNTCWALVACLEDQSRADLRVQSTTHLRSHAKPKTIFRRTGNRAKGIWSPFRHFRLFITWMKEWLSYVNKRRSKPYNQKDWD